MFKRFPVMSAAAALFLAAGAASGQGYCNFVFRTGIPDFDQRRSTAVNVVGLPGNGGMYCAPTAVVNNLTYMIDRGYPSVMLPHMQAGWDWTPPNDAYNWASAGIAAMGMQFDTDPVTGTGGYGPALLSWLSAKLPNDYIQVSSVSLDPDADNYPTPKQMAAMLQMGALVQMHIGWFELQSGHWERTGGHVVTLAGVANACSSSPTIYYRDPWTGGSDSMTTQSTFSYHSSTATLETTNLSWSNDSSNHALTHWRLNAYNNGNNRGLLNGWRAIWPNFGLGLGPVSNTLKLHVPKAFTPGGTSGAQPSIAVNGAIIAVDLGPDNIEAFAVITPGGGGAKQLVGIDFCDGSVRVVRTLTGNGGPVATDRNGDLYVIDGRNLMRIRAGDGSVRGTRSLGVDVDDMYYDDATDSLVCLSIGSRSIVKVIRSLDSLTSRPLPAVIPALTGDGSVAPNPLTGKVWLCLGGGGNSVYELTEVVGGAPAYSAASRALTGAAAPKFLQFNPRGEPMVLDGGVLREYTTDPDNGRWIPGGTSGLNGSPFGGKFRLPRGRTNESPFYATLNRDGPNIVPPDWSPAGVPDCTADVAGLGGALGPDGQLTADDIVAFLAQFFAGGLSVADVASLGGTPPADGQLTADDVVVFLTAFFAGCP